VNTEDSKAEIFDVFLCHNSEDKPGVLEIGRSCPRRISNLGRINADITCGSFWDIAIGQQIETVKSAAVCVGKQA